jgi:hypothetical protein
MRNTHSLLLQEEQKVHSFLVTVMGLVRETSPGLKSLHYTHYSFTVTPQHPSKFYKPFISLLPMFPNPA